MRDLTVFLVPQARGGGHGPVATSEAGPAVYRAADSGRILAHAKVPRGQAHLSPPPPAAISPPAFCPWCDLTGRGQHTLVDTPSNPHTVGLIALLMVLLAGGDDSSLAMNSGLPRPWLLLRTAALPADWGLESPVLRKPGSAPGLYPLKRGAGFLSSRAFCAFLSPPPRLGTDSQGDDL